MIPFGTLFNVVTVIIGGIIGLFLKKIINPELNKKAFFIIGLFTLILGFSMAVQTTNFILMFLSLICGFLFGEYVDLDTIINDISNKIKNKLKFRDDKFTDGILTAFLLYCIGSMTIVGAIDEGLGRGAAILYTKSIMDGISSIILASTFGVGVIFSVFPMLIFQGGITLLVFYYKDIIPNELINHISSVGGVIIIAIGLKILGYKKISPTNLLPSLLIVVVIFYISKLFFS